MDVEQLAKELHKAYLAECRARPVAGKLDIEWADVEAGNRRLYRAVARHVLKLARQGKLTKEPVK